jgi:ATP-dependent exoDNAse (exonuclease V) beta subunit
LYEDALTRAGIEFGVVAGAGFYERQEVIDILNLLKVLLDPFDEPALLGVLRGPFCTLRDDTLLLLCIDGTPLPRALFSSLVPDGILDAEALADARALLADLRAQRDLPLGALFEYLLNRTLFESLLLGLPGGIQRASNLRKLADVAGEFAASPEPSLRTFVSWLGDMRSAAVREGDAMLQPQEGGAVTLLTVHKSKGLEFPIVILADASGDPRGRNDDVPAHRTLGTAVVPPSVAEGTGKSVWREMINRRNKREEQDEHARLLYVALTRAEDYLIVSGSPKAGPDSWLELLDETFGVAAAPDGHALVGAGWRGVVRRSEASAPPTTNERVSAPVDWEAEFARVEKQPEFAHAPSSITVSELLNRMEAGLGDEEEREPLEEGEQRALPGFALLRGSVVHKLFELWQFGKAPVPVDAALAGVGAGPEDAKRLRAALEKIAADFEAMPLCAELGNATGLLREHPFVLRMGEGLVRGTIDAMLAPDTLIDYKTGDFHAERHERYQWQLKLYAAAARALTGTLPTRGVLVYLDKSRVEELVIRAVDADDAMALAARVMSDSATA